MIARIKIQLPFKLTMPADMPLLPLEMSVKDMEVKIYPPQRSAIPSIFGSDAVIKLNGKVSFEADILQIDFRRSAFDRVDTHPFDPSEETIQLVLRGFLSGLRYVTESYHVPMLNVRKIPWTVEYLSDQGSPLETKRPEIVGKGWNPVKYSYTLLTTDVWTNLLSLLSSGFETPNWHYLILDARGSTENPGLAVVLATTALEVFIAEILEKLSRKSSIPQELWSWINNRDYLKEPSVEEQFDRLLRILTNHSLKDNSDLWEVFKNIKAARNSFVHEGTPKFGKTVVTSELALELVNKAWEIIRVVQSWLPEDLRLPRYNYDIKLTVQG